MYLNAVRFKAPGAEVFAPMRFDTYSLIYIVGVMEQLVAEVLELGGNVTHDRKAERCDNHFRKWNPEDHTMTLCHINMAVIDDTELSSWGSVIDGVRMFRLQSSFVCLNYGASQLGSLV